MRGNKPAVENNRIVIEDKETKSKLVKMSEERNESIKNIVINLVDKEYEGDKA